MLVSLGNDLWVRARHILGFGPVAMLAGALGEDIQCAVLVEWSGWLPCTREARDIMREVCGGVR